MNLPISEYHFYINEFEAKLEESLPMAHLHLDNFGNEIFKMIKKLLVDSGAWHTFIDPIKEYNLQEPVESYQYPYLSFPDKFPQENFFVFEDMSSHYLPKVR